MAISPSESLDDILVVEREIGEMLDRERSNASQWLDETRRLIDVDMQSELARLKESAVRDRAQAEAAAQQNAAAIVETARSTAARLQALADEPLHAIVWKHIAPIVAGGERP